MMTDESALGFTVFVGLLRKKNLQTLTMLSPADKYLNKNVLNVCTSRGIGAKSPLSTSQEEQSEEAGILERH